MNLGLPGFGAHGLNHCSVANLAEHIGRTGMGVMGGREEASACGLSEEGGCSVEVSGMWERRHSAGGSEWHPSERKLRKRICSWWWEDFYGEGISIYSGSTVCLLHPHPWPSLEPCQMQNSGSCPL